MSRGALLPVFLIALGCSHRHPREDAALFGSADERDRRDALACWYSDDPKQATIVVLITRSGTAELHLEPAPGIEKTLIFGGGRLDLHRRQTALPVKPEDLAALEKAFAALPAGESVWSVELKDPAPADPFDIPRGSIPVRSYRAFFAPKDGAYKSVTVTEGPRGKLPPELPAAGPEFAGLPRLFIRIVNPDAPSPDGF